LRWAEEQCIKHQILTVDDTPIKQQNIGYKPGVDYENAIFFSKNGDGYSQTGLKCFVV
jgi:hypothetical protein